MHTAHTVDIHMEVTLQATDMPHRIVPISADRKAATGRVGERPSTLPSVPAGGDVYLLKWFLEVAGWAALSSASTERRLPSIALIAPLMNPGPHRSICGTGDRPSTRLCRSIRASTASAVTRRKSGVGAPPDAEITAAEGESALRGTPENLYSLWGFRVLTDTVEKVPKCLLAIFSKETKLNYAPPIIWHPGRCRRRL
jgi:hypothetical protein